MKGLEVLFEAFPQVIIGAFTMQALQLWEHLNILSFCFSLFSLMYGLGEILALNATNLDIDGNFIFTLWGVLATLVDTLLRCLFLSYVMSITKAYAFLILFLYVVLMVITLCCCVQKFDIRWFLRVLVSIPCSALESTDNDHPRRRFKSKVIFNLLFVVSMSFLVVSTNTNQLAGIGYSLQNSTMGSDNSTSPDCADICLNKVTSMGPTFCLYRWKYLNQNWHLTIQIVLFSLLGLSILEWILEMFLDCMPYNQLYKETHSV